MSPTVAIWRAIIFRSMLVYHFLSAQHALDDITRKRIRISRIDELNDPFELWCSAQEDRRVRVALRNYKKEMSGRFGLLCFSNNWHNPLLWSHYADKHRGICIGFEVGSKFLAPVTYVSKRMPLQMPPTEESSKQLLFTKYRDWSYEGESRVWVRLDKFDTATGHYFYDFDHQLKLREVVAGPLCDRVRRRSLVPSWATTAPLR